MENVIIILLEKGNVFLINTNIFIFFVLKFRCERCAVGFYGNAMYGTINDCMRCACPLTVNSNNFSPSCQLKELSLDMNLIVDHWQLNSSAEFVCTQCPEGFVGDHCDM